MSYSEEEKKDILSKVLKITIAEAARMKEGFAPDILIEPVLAKAREIIEKYENDPEVDIWWNARLDKYTTWTIHNIMMENYEEYTLNEENLEATVVATGGLAPYVIPYCKRRDIIIDDNLLLKGLLVLYRKNE